MTYFQLEALPYQQNALEPHISSNTVDFHYNKHHATYVANLNKFITDTDYVSMSLIEIVKASWQKKDMSVFNNAAQVWNHDFFWKSMKSNGGGMPTGKIAEKINASFSTYDNFKDEFIKACLGQFGSGWVFVALQNDKVVLLKKPNAESAICDAQVTPLLVCDVWEHAYYLDYQNKRVDFANVFVDKLINWDFANANIS